MENVEAIEEGNLSNDPLGSNSVEDHQEGYLAGCEKTVRKDECPVKSLHKLNPSLGVENRENAIHDNVKDDTLRLMHPVPKYRQRQHSLGSINSNESSETTKASNRVEDHFWRTRINRALKSHPAMEQPSLSSLKEKSWSLSSPSVANNSNSRWALLASETAPTLVHPPKGLCTPSYAALAKYHAPQPEDISIELREYPMNTSTNNQGKRKTISMTENDNDFDNKHPWHSLKSPDLFHLDDPRKQPLVSGSHLNPIQETSRDFSLKSSSTFEQSISKPQNDINQNFPQSTGNQDPSANIQIIPVSMPILTSATDTRGSPKTNQVPSVASVNIYGKSPNIGDNGSSDSKLTSPTMALGHCSVGEATTSPITLRGSPGSHATSFSGSVCPTMEGTDFYYNQSVPSEIIRWPPFWMKALIATLILSIAVASITLFIIQGISLPPPVSSPTPLTSDPGTQSKTSPKNETTLPPEVPETFVPWSFETQEPYPLVTNTSSNEKTQPWNSVGTTLNGEKPNQEAGTFFALARSGSILAVSSRGGLVRVYKSEFQKWVPFGQDLLRSTDEASPIALASKDGTILAVYSNGFVRTYHYDKGQFWKADGNPIATNISNIKGSSLSLSATGKTLAVATPQSSVLSGQVRVFEYRKKPNSSGMWDEMGGILRGYDRDNGFSIALSRNGQRLAVGSWRLSKSAETSVSKCEVQMYELKFNSTSLEKTWEPIRILIDLTKFMGNETSLSLSLSADGNVLALCVPQVCFVLSWDSDENAWKSQANRISGGFSVSLSWNASTLIVGDPTWKKYAGKAQVYRSNDGNAWVPDGSILLGKSEGERCGASVALSGSRFAVASPKSLTGNKTKTGMVEVFSLRP